MPCGRHGELGTSAADLGLRLQRAGFGHLLRPEILSACRNSRTAGDG